MSAKAGQQAYLIFPGKLVLPQTHHPPPLSVELTGDEKVARLVTGDLRPPKLGVLLRLRGMERAPVPETTVREDGELELGENEVGFTEDPGFVGG